MCAISCTLAAVDGNDAYTVFAPQPLAATLLLDAEALVGALAATLNDAGLRAQVSAWDLERAAVFSWAGTALTVLVVYHGTARA